MNKLRGSGNTFSISGKQWLPFRFDPKIASRNAKLHRLKRQGLLPTKAELASMCQQAVAQLQHKLKPLANQR